MKTTSLRLFSWLAVLTLVSWACGLSNAGTPAAAAEVTATIQDEAPTATSTLIPATDTPAPTDTPAVTPTDTLTPEPSATPTAEVVTGLVGRESNCRIGPGGNYALVATYQAGQKVEIIAQDLGGGFVFVRNPDKPDEQCYMLANSLQISGEVAALPQYTPLPSPTLAPSFNATFKKFDECKGEPFTVFIIENTGSVPFASAYIKVTDLKVNKSVEQAVNAFDQYTGCVIAKNIAPLMGGSTGFLVSPVFKLWNPRGDKLLAVLMVCTDKNLKGVCVTQTVNVSPK